jgi:hypothetical protein
MHLEKHMREKNPKTSFWLLAFTILFSAHLFAQTDQEAAELAKKTQNPVSDMISLPFQNNTNFGIGQYNRTQNVLNIQPVAPFNLNEKWNLITRTIVPVILQPDIAESSGSTFGLGDINASLFLSPAKPGKIIWGAGPVLSFPTATNRVLGTGKWGIGPSAVALTMSGPWVIGVLANNVWSVAGNSERGNVSFFLLQYFINYNMSGGWYITSSPVITANWKADSDNRWTVPFGIGAGRIFHAGSQPMNAQIAFYYNVASPEFGADWTLRVQLQLLFPKK